MVGADETTELWGPPCSEFFISYVRIPSSGACSIILYGSINYGFFIMNYVHILLRKCFMKKAQEGLNCNFKYDLINVYPVIEVGGSGAVVAVVVVGVGISVNSLVVAAVVIVVVAS